MKISLVIKCNMIIRKYELRLSNSTTLAIAFLLSFEMLPVTCFAKSFATTYNSNSLLVIASESDYSSKKTQTIGLKKWKWKWKMEILALVFSKGVTRFYGIILAVTFSFSKISKTNLKPSLEYLQRHFLNRRLVFFWNRPLIDR